MSWDSRRLVRRASWGALLLLAALAAAGVAAARVAGRADSGRVVRRVIVSDAGIRVQSPDSSSSKSAEERADFDHGIVIGNRHHRVHVGDVVVEGSGSGKSVRVMGPMVLVDGEGAGLVRVFADAEVPAGKRVEGDVVAVFGSVTVGGQVSGNVVAVLGSVHLDPGASVEGDAVAIGGKLDQPSGAAVSGQSVSLGFFPITWGLPALPILLLTVLLGWLANLLMGWILHLLFPRRMLRVAVTASRRTGLSLLLGVFSAPLMVVAMVLLLITVLGIPIAVLLPIFYGLLVWAGQIAASYVIGCKLIRRPLGEGGAMLPFAIGTLFVSAFFVAGAAFGIGFGFSRPLALFFHLLGVLLLIGLTTIGTGAFLLSSFGSRPADIGARAGAAEPATGTGPMVSAPGTPHTAH